MPVPQLQPHCQRLASHTPTNGCLASTRCITSVPSVIRQRRLCQQQCLVKQQHNPQHQPALMSQALVNDSQSSSAVETQPAPSTSGRQDSRQEPLLTFAEVQQIAAARGLHISLKTLGPGYRIVCRDGELNSSSTLSHVHDTSCWSAAVCSVWPA